MDIARREEEKREREREECFFHLRHGLWSRWGQIERIEDRQKDERKGCREEEKKRRSEEI